VTDDDGATDDLTREILVRARPANAPSGAGQPAATPSRPGKCKRKRGPAKAKGKPKSKRKCKPRRRTKR
jgi:hypothetical protein